MTIPLDEFEQVIDRTILKRGFNYYNDGNVLDIEEIAEGEYEAIVMGSEEDVVSLQVKNNSITRYNCECPYDLGLVCKHIVAAIFSLQKDILLMDLEKPEKKEKKKATAKSSKRSKSGSGTAAQKLSDILVQLSESDLKAFIHDKAKDDKTFRNNFFATYEYFIPSGEISKATYQQQLRSVFKQAGGNRRFIHWRNMPDLVNDIVPFLENAQNHFQAKNFRTSFHLCAAFLEEVTKALDYTDDSSGYLGAQIDAALTIFEKLTAEDLDEKLRKELFNYSVSAYKKEIFSGWDWHLGMLKFSVALTKTETEADLLLEILKGVSEDRLDKKEAQALQLVLLEKFKEKEAAEAFLRENLSNRLIRKAEIEKAIDNKDFNLGIALAKGGIRQDSKTGSGYLKDWYEYLLKIGRALDDREMIIQSAKFLYLDDYMPIEDFYEVLKENVSTVAWPVFVNDLVKEIEATGGWREFDLIRNIYIKEKRWDKLFRLISQNPTLTKLSENRKYLAKDYEAQLVDLYSVAVKDDLEQNVGRKYYQRLLTYLRQMKKLGGEKKLIELQEYLREKYKMRLALLEELDKV
ncbi:hypothetical protein LZ575_17620 [Antarcticibacterium sp. 1MA-6-2]|uniref:SWIM zinc finger family protein n=1 Tax=Antarcticibacterium sp. 1MA-6-2 TaxID=2908210 RepID=UPI001F2F8272|nr:SWIM zinc finger family protein [Antarcticibacterium sp. 1MA-6-2]UJH90584.1 hypothetical protein LZ575_17620 [Antarcticibacterium sp. 1MA-6-2]